MRCHSDNMRPPNLRNRPPIGKKKWKRLWCFYTLRVLQSHSALSYPTGTFPICHMHFPHAFVLPFLSFVVAAVSQAEPPPTSRGIAIPIAKRVRLPFIGRSSYASLVQNPIA